MTNFHLKIITPEKIIYDDVATMVMVNSIHGQIGILPNHVNYMTRISPGELRIQQGNKELVMALGDGFLQMADNNLLILTDLAKQPEEIDVAMVEEAHRRAKSALEHNLSEEEYATTLGIIEKSLAQLRVKRRHRSH